MNYPTKTELRKNILQIRKNINQSKLKTDSQIINVLLINFFSKLKADIVCSYYPFNNEVNINEFNKYIIKKFGHLYLPKIINSFEFELYKIFNYSKTNKNKFGIPEPISNKKLIIKNLDFNNKICIICPGLVFDKNGNRIGFGKGYYDTFFHKHNPDLFYKIGVTFDFGLFDKIPFNQHDIKMDLIITESNKIVINDF